MAGKKFVRVGALVILLLSGENYREQEGREREYLVRRFTILLHIGEYSSVECRY